MYQAEAVAAITADLAGGGRRQLRAACGTGKTFIASVTAAKLADGGVTVVLVPSIALAAQTITGWHVELGPGRNDEGVDIRAWDAEPGADDPAVLLVQCKRTAARVDKVVVKALAADVMF